MQERRNSSALAMKLRISCNNPIDMNVWSLQHFLKKHMHTHVATTDI